MKLQPYTIALHIYATDETEARELEEVLKQFVMKKYQNGIYPRAAAVSRVIQQYGDIPIVNNFIR